MSQQNDRPGGVPWGGIRRPTSMLPSFNFLLLLLIFFGLGAALWHDWLSGRFVVFVFVLAGWTVSLCLHEFGHAVVAYYGGDASVARTGYLDLDPARYTDPVLSLILPVAFILLGGFGLPGGAIYVKTGALRSREWKAAMAAAGPFANLVVLALLAGLYQALLHEKITPGSTAIIDLASGLAVLALFQATAVILNLLPFPGLDGFGVLRPFLPARIAVRVEQVGSAAILILFLLIWLTPVGGALIRVGVAVTTAFGFDIGPIARGFGMMRLF